MDAPEESAARAAENDRLDALISELARTVSFDGPAPELSTVALNENGQLTEYLPDGSTKPFESRSPRPEAPGA